MWINVRVLDGPDLVHEVNPYDYEVGTLKGLSAAGSPPLDPGEVHAPALIYEVKMSSALTGETTSFHMALATERYKDNRIPPKGFDIAAAPDRIVQPIWAGEDAPDLYTAAEYAGGYDQVSLDVAPGGTAVEIRLFYQTTSREYVAFLRDEIRGEATTLPSPGPAGGALTYVAATSPDFAALQAWGDTIWELWAHNRTLPGAAPVLMAEEVVQP